MKNSKIRCRTGTHNHGSGENPRPDVCNERNGLAMGIASHSWKLPHMIGGVCSLENLDHSLGMEKPPDVATEEIMFSNALDL